MLGLPTLTQAQLASGLEELTIAKSKMRFNNDKLDPVSLMDFVLKKTISSITIHFKNSKWFMSLPTAGDVLRPVRNRSWDVGLTS